MEIKVCPRCGSSNIKWIIPQNWSMSSCNECGFTGPVIEVDDTTQKKLQENWIKNKDKILSHTNDEEEPVEDDLDDEQLEEKLDKLFEEE